MGKLVVKVDPDLSDLISGFMTRKRKDVEFIRTAANNQDYAALSNLGHRIKGEGGSYGLDGISQIGEELEAAAKRQDVAACLAIADRLSDYLGRVAIVFE